MAMHSDPTATISIDLPGYIANRAREQGQHLVSGVPNYSFSLDNKLRRNLSTMQPLRGLAKLLVRVHEPFFQQLKMMNAIAVSPSQYPELFAIGERCARRLGIGVPRIFVEFSELPNAYTFASDDVRPSIVVTTRLLRSLKDDEMLGVIGHECGHIHNLHVAYNTLVVVMSQGGTNAVLRGGILWGASAALVNGLAQVAGLGVQLFLLRWSRCAEITCDRAGAICAGSVAPMIRALVKLKTGGEAQLTEIDVDHYVRQLEVVKSTPLRLVELLHSHPLTQKRIEALRLFNNSEMLVAWRPELRSGGPVRSQRELDERCEALVRIWDNRRSYTEGEGDFGLERH